MSDAKQLVKWYFYAWFDGDPLICGDSYQIRATDLVTGDTATSTFSNTAAAWCVLTKTPEVAADEDARIVFEGRVIAGIGCEETVPFTMSVTAVSGIEIPGT